jgi:lysozyme
MNNRAGVVGGAIVAALGLAVPFVQNWEGLVLTPHHDMVGTPDGCFGDTTVERRNYTPDECSVLLVSRLASDYAPAVIKCVPGLADKPKPLAASLALSYNIGVSAFCRSTAAKRFNAGDWTGGCDAFLMWRFAGGKEVRGLLNRRRAERELCLR